VNRLTQIGEDNYEVEVALNSHVPEILPINDKRLHVSYLGQLKQCRNCFGQGHIASTCEVDKVDWIEYVATLHKSGKFDNDLFEGWMPALKQYHSSYKEQPADAVSVLDFGQTQRRQNVNQGGQILDFGQTQRRQGFNQGGQNNQAYNFQGSSQNYSGPPNQANQGVFQFNSNNYRGQGRPRANNRGFRGQNRGRARGRGNQAPSSNYFNCYQ